MRNLGKLPVRRSGIAMNDRDGLKYLLTDHLGLVAAVLSEVGTLISEQRYREAPPECPEGHEGGMPYGEVRVEIGTIAIPSSVRVKSRRLGMCPVSHTFV